MELFGNRSFKISRDAQKSYKKGLDEIQDPKNHQNQSEGKN